MDLSSYKTKHPKQLIVKGGVVEELKDNLVITKKNGNTETIDVTDKNLDKTTAQIRQAVKNATRNKSIEDLGFVKE